MCLVTDSCMLPFPAGLKVDRMTQKIWFTLVTFDGASGSYLQTKLFGCDPDF